MNPDTPFPLPGGPSGRLCIAHLAHSKKLPPPGVAHSITHSLRSFLFSHFWVYPPSETRAGYILVCQSSREPPRKEQGIKGPSDTDVSKCESGWATAPSPGELGPGLQLLRV